MQKEERRHRSSFLFFERVANVRSEGTATWMATWTSLKEGGRRGVQTARHADTCRHIDMTLGGRHPSTAVYVSAQQFTGMAGLRRVVVVVVAVAMAAAMWVYADRLSQALLLRTGRRDDDEANMRMCRAGHRMRLVI